VAVTICVICKRAEYEPENSQDVTGSWKASLLVVFVIEELWATVALLSSPSSVALVVQRPKTSIIRVVALTEAH